MKNGSSLELLKDFWISMDGLGMELSMEDECLV